MMIASKSTRRTPIPKPERGRAARSTALAVLLLAVGPVLGGREFRTDCGAVELPGAPNEPTVCIGYCSRTQGSVYCVAGDGENRFPRSPQRLANLSGNVWLHASDEPTVAQLSRALERVSGWTVQVDDALLERRLSITRRFSTWFDLLDRSFKLRGRGRVRIEADAARHAFRITERPS